MIIRIDAKEGNFGNELLAEIDRRLKDSGLVRYLDDPDAYFPEVTRDFSIVIEYGRKAQDNRG